MDEQSVEESLAEAVSKTAQDEVADGMLLGFVLVSEWMNPDGQRWLSVHNGNAVGERIVPWQMRGYLNEALNHWPDETVGPDEE